MKVFLLFLIPKNLMDWIGLVIVSAICIVFAGAAIELIPVSEEDWFFPIVFRTIMLACIIMIGLKNYVQGKILDDYHRKNKAFPGWFYFE